MANIETGFDISAVGTIIDISPSRGGRGCTITNFSDEGTPFDAPDVDASTNRKNLNGTMISSRLVSVRRARASIAMSAPGRLPLG